jgi:hypothetical protein
MPFTWRGSTYNYNKYGSQNSWILHERTSFKSKTSKVEYIIVSIWYCDHLPFKQPSGKAQCPLTTILFGTKEGDPILDQQKSIVLKPINFQLKNLGMSSCEDASYFMEVQEALKDNPFVKNIRERSYINEINDDFDSRMDCYTLRDFCIYLQGLYDSR